MGLVRTKFLGAGTEAKAMDIRSGMTGAILCDHATATYLGLSGLRTVDKSHTASAGGAGAPPLLPGSILGSRRLRAFEPSCCRKSVSLAALSWEKSGWFAAAGWHHKFEVTLVCP